MSDSSSQDSTELDVVVTVDDVEASRGGEKGIFGSSGDPFVTAIPVQTLQKNVRAAVNALREVFKEAAAETDGLVLHQIQVGFEISATGKIALVGTSLEGAGKSTLTLTFMRQ